MANGPAATWLAGVAAVARTGAPVTPLVASDSPLTNPVTVAVNVGFAAPYARVSSAAVTVRTAGVTVWPVAADVLGVNVASPA